MVPSSTCRSPCQNPHNNKDKLAGGTLTKCSNCCTPAPAATCASTPYFALIVTLFAAFGSANSSMIRYLEDDLQQILKTVSNFRPLTPILAPVVAAVPYYKGPSEQSLKAQFPDIYWDKTHLECYNFF